MHSSRLCIVPLTGSDIINALETGVSLIPGKLGRFPWVSNIFFKFNSTKPRGQRVLIHSVKISGKPIDLNKIYSVGTVEYLLPGKNGYTVFANKPYTNTHLLD